MHIAKLPRRLLAFCVTLYQKTLSPDHGFPRVLFPYGFCPQHPTCSEYSKAIILERGAIIGGALALKRILTCHPWRKPDDRRILEAIRRHEQR